MQTSPGTQFRPGSTQIAQYGDMEVGVATWIVDRGRAEEDTIPWVTIPNICPDFGVYVRLGCLRARGEAMTAVVGEADEVIEKLLVGSGTALVSPAV